MIGVVRRRLTLQVAEEATIPLEVLIQQPGVHNLQTLCIYVWQNGEKKRHNFSMQWLSTVTAVL